MILTDQLIKLLNATMSVLDGTGPDATPQRGTGIIDQWLVQLRRTENATEITNSLERVKTQLKSGQIDVEELSQLLERLATHTVEVSMVTGLEGDADPQLEKLSSALRSLAGQLSS